MTGKVISSLNRGINPPVKQETRGHVLPWIRRSWAGRGPALPESALRPVRLVQVVAQDLGAGRVAQLGHRLRFDLADAFAGHAVDLSDFV